jgi:photosystem II stability/assembly factor-like uncharacterized protein
MRSIRLAFLPLLFLLAASPARCEWIALKTPTAENAQSLWFTNASTGFLAASSVWRTDDGAATWKKLEIPSGNYMEIRFRDALTGFIAGTGTLLKTTDGGNQWQPVGQGSHTFRKLALSGNVVYGLTGGRGLWKSSNGGIAWDSLADMGTLINHFAFPDYQSGFVSNQRDIYKTSDGGKQWRKVYSIRLGGLITDMQFLNSDTGYASAYYPGSILSTYDGGETWNEVPAKYWLYGLHFSDSRHGWVVGNSLGEVLRTTDAGVTWLPEATGVTGNFKDVYFPTADVGYILALANTGILKYSNSTTSARPVAKPVGRGQAPHRYFDILGAHLAPKDRATIWRVVPGLMPIPLWPSNGAIDISE